MAKTVIANSIDFHKRVGNGTTNEVDNRCQEKKLPNDIENDIQHKLMGSIGKIKMVPGCPPSRLDCQGKLKDAGNTLLKQDGKEKPNSSNDTVEPKLDETIKCQSLVTIKEAGSLLRTPKDSNNVGRFITIAPIDNQTNKNNFVSNPVKTVRDNNHIDSIPCHYCKNPIPGFVYSCLECEYHMCHLCNIDSVHAHHYVLRGPFGRNSVEVAKVKKKVMQILKPADMEVGSDLNNTTLPIEDNIKEEKDLDFDMEIKTEIKIEEHDPLAQLGMEQRSSMFVDSLSDTNVSILPE
ncbi:unnamed protein product [Diatraea saccharalis]|uniref:Uncharacterized protein n=1 Tax=Diatraea saccharalis TaxID=40085 RepID=A0A9N9REF1_9NEOP|nr:unnamed protein product [Diatraea saccharalis]